MRTITYQIQSWPTLEQWRNREKRERKGAGGQRIVLNAKPLKRWVKATETERVSNTAGRDDFL